MPAFESVGPRDSEGDETGGVAILVWPTDSNEFERLAAKRTPRLVLVEPGCEPPVAAECCQDWMWRTGTPHEFRLRLRQLALRAIAHTHAVPYVDSAGMLHVGLRSVHLTAIEQRLVAVLIDRFNQRVPAADLVAVGWPGRRPRRSILATRLSVLRGRIKAVGLELPGSSREGYTLRASTAPLDPGGHDVYFDAELDAGRWLGRP